METVREWTIEFFNHADEWIGTIMGHKGTKTEAESFASDYMNNRKEWEIRFRPTHYTLTEIKQ